MTDKEYYTAYLGGDDKGLEALIDRYGNALTLYINAYIHDITEAESLMLDVFAYLFVKKPDIKKADGLKAYLYKAARNMALRHKSRRHIHFSLDELEDIPDTAMPVLDSLIHSERIRTLYECLSKIKSDYREALYLVYFNGLSYAQAGKVLRKSEKQITNLIYRGKQNLRELLEKEGVMYDEF